jgi:hypothetical protein
VAQGVGPEFKPQYCKKKKKKKSPLGDFIAQARFGNNWTELVAVLYIVKTNVY